MKFDSLKTGDFETFDHIFDEIWSCLDKNFGIEEFIALADVPSFVKHDAQAIIFFKSTHSPETSYRKIMERIDQDRSLYELISVPVVGLDDTEYSLRLYIKNTSKMDPSAIDRIKYIGKDAFSKCLERKISSMRDYIVTMSFQTRDIGSFLHKAVVVGLVKFIKFEGTSVFYYDYQNDFLSLGSTTGIKKIRDKSIKRTDVKYDRTSKSRVRISFSEGVPIYEDENFGDEVPNNHYGEDVERIRNRLYVPIDVRSNLKRKLIEDYGNESRTDGKVGLLRIVNLKRNGILGPISVIDFHLLEYFCEYVAVLGARYIKALSIIHDQEKATHGFITDLSTIKLQAQLFDMQTSKAFDNAPKAIIQHHPVFLSSLQGQIDIYLRNLLSVQDGMSFQLGTVLQHTEGAVGYSAEHDGRKCDKPFVQVFMRILDAGNGICGTYNRKPAKITLGRANQTPHEIREMPGLDAPRKTVYLAVRNVVENAIKYTPRARAPQLTIVWSVFRETMLIDISDQAIGIGQDDRRKIFDEGFRSRRAMQTSLRGHGLGLPVSRLGIRSFGGDIVYLGNGPNNRGSLFRISIPTN